MTMHFGAEGEMRYFESFLESRCLHEGNILSSDFHCEYGKYYKEQCGQDLTITNTKFTKEIGAKYPQMKPKHGNNGSMYKNLSVKGIDYEFTYTEKNNKLNREHYEENSQQILQKKRISRQCDKLFMRSFPCTLEGLKTLRRHNLLRYHYDNNNVFVVAKSVIDTRSALNDHKASGKKFIIKKRPCHSHLTSYAILRRKILRHVGTLMNHYRISQEKITYLQQNPEEERTANESYVLFMSRIPEEITSTTVSTELYDRILAWFEETEQLGEELSNSGCLGRKQTEDINEYLDKLSGAQGHIQSIFEYSAQNEEEEEVEDEPEETDNEEEVKEIPIETVPERPVILLHPRKTIAP